MSRKTRWFLFTLLAVVALDQATKLWISSNLELWRGHIDVIPGFFQLVHYQNKGAVGGILGDSEFRIPIFIAFTVVALGAMVAMVRKLEPIERFVPFVLGMIAGGAIGNAIDRALYGAVFDFILLHITTPNITFRWYVFNLADVAIVAGVIGLIYEVVFGRNAVKAP